MDRYLRMRVNVALDSSKFEKGASDKKWVLLGTGWIPQSAKCSGLEPASRPPGERPDKYLHT